MRKLQTYKTKSEYIIFFSSNELTYYAYVLDIKRQLMSLLYVNYNFLFIEYLFKDATTLTKSAYNNKSYDWQLKLKKIIII